MNAAILGRLVDSRQLAEAPLLHGRVGVAVTMPAPEKITEQAAEDHRGSKEPPPFGNSDQPNQQESGDNEQANRMTRPEARAKPAEWNDLHGMPVVIHASNDFTQRVTAKRGRGFHGFSPFAIKPLLQKEAKMFRLGYSAVTAHSFRGLLGASTGFSNPITLDARPGRLSSRFCKISRLFRASRGGLLTPPAGGPLRRRGRCASASRPCRR